MQRKLAMSWRYGPICRYNCKTGGLETGIALETGLVRDNWGVRI